MCESEWLRAVVEHISEPGGERVALVLLLVVASGFISVLVPLVAIWFGGKYSIRELRKGLGEG
jgi:hypothetical protein